MLKLQKDLRDELKDDYESYMDSTVTIAMTIAFYAHKDQVRVNNEQYITHPMAIAEHFKQLTMIERIIIGERIMIEIKEKNKSRTRLATLL